MPLGDVAQFMAQYRRQLVTVAHRANQAQMHAQVATRQRKGIDAAVTNQKQLPGKALVQLRRDVPTRARCRHQGLPNALQVVPQHRVVDVVWIPVNAGGNALANASLCGGG